MTPAQSQIVLSLFPGIGLLDAGFELEGFCVVRGPDLIFGGDIRRFTAPPGKFDGIIGGPPCQDFSGLRRTPPTGIGLAMLAEFARVVTEARPTWFVCENVARVPDLIIDGYRIQRFDLRASDYGLPQRRLRHIQFGSNDGTILSPDRPFQSRPVTVSGARCVTTKADGRTFSEACAAQGIPWIVTLPAFTRAAAFRAVGNGVPVPMARAIAAAVSHRRPEWMNADLCICGCGRRVTGREISAGPACRKRMERARKRQPTSQPV